jgi:hypothetical protein
VGFGPSKKNIDSTNEGGKMRPQGDHILRAVATTMATKYLPQVASDHGKSDFGLLALLMGVVSEEFERAAHRRIEENSAIRKIFKDALPVLKDEGLKKRVKEASEKTEDDYRISALDKLNCDLQEVLIDLHANIETIEGEDARRIEEQIWVELENWTKRREFMIWELANAMLAAASKG